MNTAPFHDHFSAVAASYAAFRPRYPDALFDWVASLAPGRTLAWDAATGNGQAARSLAERFARVVATDASAEQIAHAARHPRVEYVVARAEDGGLAPGSCDLVTVAQALHWLDAPAFFAQVHRALRPGGAIAVWVYVEPELTEPAVDAVLQGYVRLVYDDWPPERRLTDAGYRTIDFPFDEVTPPAFHVEMTPTRGELCGYLGTWSATRAFLARTGHDPLPEVAERLAAVWPTGERRRLRWPVKLRAGHVPAR